MPSQPCKRNACAGLARAGGKASLRVLLGGAAFFHFCVVAWCLPGAHSPCRIQPAQFEGWDAHLISNDWVRLTIVPKLGGRLMQVEFAGHPYLFVNPKYKGKYFPPMTPGKGSHWYNYGGDKLWPLPEGRGPDGLGDDQHWPGPVSDVLDDGDYALTILSQGARCTVRLEGPADPATGLQYTREISIGNNSPEISFYAVMRNASQRVIRWSVQSVTQYDTADAQNAEEYNHDFWAFTPVNAHSAYREGYHVRTGLTDDPSFAIDNGLFVLHWLYLENEVWLDSNAGWLAVVNDAAKYGMVERFRYSSGEEYPGAASLIFYKNGAALDLDERGMPRMRSANPADAPYYMEAEINSPMIRLEPGASYTFDTNWFPVRASKDCREVTVAGMICRPLSISATGERVELTGSFAVFFSGKLSAHVLDDHGAEVAVASLMTVDPGQSIELQQTIKVAAGAARISIHLEDDQGTDRGSLGEARIVKG